LYVKILFNLTLHDIIKVEFTLDVHAL